MCNLCCTWTGKYLWTSKTFLHVIHKRQVYWKPRTRFSDRMSHLVDQWSTHFTLQQLTGTFCLHKKYEWIEHLFLYTAVYRVNRRINIRTQIYCHLNMQSSWKLYHLIEQLMLILHIANRCYCTQALCTGIEKLTCPKASKIDQSLDGNKYTHIETYQLLKVLVLIEPYPIYQISKY